MSLAKTLKQLRKQKGWTQETLASESGVSRAAIAQVETGKGGFNIENQASIATAFQVDPTMLEFVKNSESDKSKVIQPYWNDDGEGVPYYDVDVFAGDVIAINDMNFEPVSYIKLPGATDCDFGCRVSGNSMTNKIYPGAIILCKEIRNKDIIAFGEVHLVATDEQRLVKFVRRHPTKMDCLLLRSLNPDFDDIEVKREDVKRLFLVKVIVNQEQM